MLIYYRYAKDIISKSIRRGETAQEEEGYPSIYSTQGAPGRCSIGALNRRNVEVKSCIEGETAVGGEVMQIGRAHV